MRYVQNEYIHVDQITFVHEDYLHYFPSQMACYKVIYEPSDYYIKFQRGLICLAGKPIEDWVIITPGRHGLLVGCDYILTGSYCEDTRRIVLSWNIRPPDHFLTISGEILEEGRFWLKEGF
jgi:hypothetical protein